MNAPLSALVDDPATPIERIAFAIARDVYPHLDEARFDAALDAMAEPLVARAQRAKEPRQQASLLTSHVYGALGFRGDEQSYYDPQNSYVPLVIERKKGIPITLAVVLVAIGRRAGIVVEGVGFPGHFLARVGGEEGVLIDPFFRGQLMDAPALERLAKRAMGPNSAVLPQHLAPSDNRAIAVRMLSNLDAIYGARKEHSLAMLVCDRLFELTSAPERLRDRGLHAMSLGAVASAAQDLSRYLGLRPDAPDRSQVLEALTRARGARVTLH
jgi:regulator of sirC expression with transglutaminase-like and TPR domain